MLRPTEDYLTHYFDIARYQWLFAFSIGVFCTLFLLVFQPFGVSNFDPGFHITLEFLLIVSAFGLLIAACVAMNEFLLRPLLLKKLTRRRLTGWLVWTWLLIATAVFLFYNYLGNRHGLKLTVEGAGQSVPVSRAYTGIILQKLGTPPGDD